MTGLAAAAPFAVAAAQLLLVGFLMASPAALAPALRRDLHLGAGELGLLGSSFLWAYAAVQIPVGLLVDARGVRSTLLAASALMSLGCLGLGLAPSLGWAVAGRTVSGLGAAMVYVPMLKLILALYGPERFDRPLSVANGAGYGAGLILASYPLAYSVAQVGWRWTMVAASAFSLLLMLLVALTMRPHCGGPASVQPPGPGIIGPKLDWRGALRLWAAERSLWAFTLVHFLTSGSLQSFQGLWAGPFGESILGLRGGGLGGFLLLMPLGLMAGYAAVAALAPAGRRRPVVIAGAVAYAVAWLGLLLGLVVQMAWLGILSVVLMAGSRGTVASGFGLVMAHAPPEHKGLMTAIVNASPFLGGACFQFLVGLMLETSPAISDPYSPLGFSMAFATISAGAVAAVLFSTLLRDPEPDHWARAPMARD